MKNLREAALELIVNLFLVGWLFIIKVNNKLINELPKANQYWLLKYPSLWSIDIAKHIIFRRMMLFLRYDLNSKRIF